MGCQLFICLLSSILHGLEVRYRLGSLSMKTMKLQKKGLTAWSTRYWLEFSYIPCGFSCPFMGVLLHFKIIISLAGLWSLFHADIYWSFLSCSLAPQFFDSSPSLDSASSYIWGEVILFCLDSFNLDFTAAWLDMLLNWKCYPGFRELVGELFTLS